MVDRIMVDPSVELITEADLQAPRLMPGGLCFICGTWVDHERMNDYVVTLERSDGERQEHLAHAACLAEVAHPSSALLKQVQTPAPREPAEPAGVEAPEPAATAGETPPDHLDPKPFTADGR
jgi:hypothetical protein